MRTDDARDLRAIRDGNATMKARAREIRERRWLIKHRDNYGSESQSAKPEIRFYYFSGSLIAYSFRSRF